MKENVFWTDPPLIAKDYSINQPPGKTDVLLIGSGYTSVTAALRLAEKGVRTVVIDKHEIGSEASSKNGGMVLTGLSVGFFSVMSQFGEDKLKQYFCESLSSINCVEQLVTQGQIDCNFVRCGHLEAACRPAHFDGLKREAEFLFETLGHQTMIIPRERLREELGSKNYYGALMDPKSASVQPAKYMAGLVRLAEQAGVEFYSHVEAVHIEKLQGKFTIITNLGPISAENVVIGTNGYTTMITPWLKKRIVPVESFMVATEPLPGDLTNALIPNNRMVFDTKNFLHYFRLSPDRSRILFGGRPKKMTTSNRKKTVSLKNDLYKTFPELSQYKLEYAWGGKTGFTVSKFPVIGNRNGLYYAVGYCGRGVAMATYLGTKLSDAILGNEMHTIFTENKAVPLPFNKKKSWFLPLAHTWFRLKDLVS